MAGNPNSVSCTSTSPSFLDDVISGLNQRPRWLPCKYFYDDRGAMLFERICDLDSYYLSRAELEIMHRFAPQIAQLLGPELMLVEFGSGNCQKSRLLLDALNQPVAYVPIDVAEAQLGKAAEALAARRPMIEILPVCADFLRLADLPTPSRAPARKALYFPGSTIGNFPPQEMQALIRRIVELCGFGGAAVIGIDLKKDTETIEEAYNDLAGITEQFNLNLLRRINCELDADFQLDQFKHRASYNNRLGRVEMYLVSQSAQSVTVRGNRFYFAAGERICTEYSYKYRVRQFADLVASEGLKLCEYWTDAKQRFAVLQFDILA